MTFAMVSPGHGGLASNVGITPIRAAAQAAAGCNRASADR